MRGTQQYGKQGHTFGQCECFTFILKAYQFETRQQETDLLVPVNHSTSMSSQLEMAM